MNAAEIEKIQDESSLDATNLTDNQLEQATGGSIPSPWDPRKQLIMAGYSKEHYAAMKEETLNKGGDRAYLEYLFAGLC